MTDQIMVEGNAVIGELEIQNMQLSDDLEAANKRCTEEREWSRTLRNIIQRDRKGYDLDVVSIIRDMLDEADYEDDNEKMRELRKMLWNDSDTDKQIAAEGYGYDEEANTAAWFEMNVGV